METEKLDRALYLTVKKFGYPDKVIERISGQPLPCHIPAVFKMVDTCGAEFNAETPYFYSTYDEENEAAEFIAEPPRLCCVSV